jgi:pimeloyl-ACP methyl ester carboxylesterase
MSHFTYEHHLPSGIRSRYVDNTNGLRMHVLEAGYESPERPVALLLHGFPELAWSWRHVMLELAREGWHVLAPDQRGYGATTGWDGDYDGNLANFRLMNLARDTLGLVFALGLNRVDALMGHDFGAILAPWCVLTRPDVFRSLVLMSAPFAGPPAIPSASEPPATNVHAELASLLRPRKHYHQYYSTRAANTEMRTCPQGVHAFLRAYFHVKSADWEGNLPHPLTAWNASELAKLPTYYVMDIGDDMAATVAPYMPDKAAVTACEWLPEAALSIYSAAFSHTGFQGGLNWYRARASAQFEPELQIFAGCKISVPTMFIAGASDWGAYQTPGALERMRDVVCTNMAGCHLLDGAGHWVQQEQPESVARLLREFLSNLRIV